MCKLKSINDEEFIKIVNTSSYLKDVLLACGYKATLHKKTRDKVKKRIYDLNINTDHFKYPERKSIDELCIKNGKYHRGGLKKRLIKEKILCEICYECGQPPIHNNKKLVLQLDHINGINTDNRLSNLRLLCPNCHSQTPTFSGKKRNLV